MTRRRTFIRGASVCGIASIAGCVDAFFGDGPITFEASPGRVAADALDATGYEFDASTPVVIEREFSAGGQTREVRVTNHLTEYEKSIDMGLLGSQRGAVFSVLTTPQVRVLGQEFNPVADMSTADLADLVQDQYDGIQNLTHQEDTEVTIYGETTVQSKFRTEGQLGGELVDLFLHISQAVDFDDDLVVTVGGYPEFTPGEEAHILQLMAGVEPSQ